jgi:hypothetical protein
MKDKSEKINLRRILINIPRINKMDQDPILIGGCGRTGTSLMSAILDAHPDIISYPAETNIFESDRKFRSPRLNSFRNKVRFYRFLIRQDIQKGTRRWCEKTPSNIDALDHIFKEFRNRVKIVLMVRDGRDVITSLHPLSKGYYISLKRWLIETSLTLQYSSHENVLVVPYESLTVHFDATMKKILDFLGSSFDDKVKEYTKFSGVQSHDAFHGNKLTGISTGSVERWRQDRHKERVGLLTESPEAMDLLERVEQYRKEFEQDD